MAQAGFKAYLGDIAVNYKNLYLGDKNSFINPFEWNPIPSQGLIALFDATNLNSYPGSGSIWYDLSPNKLVATTFSSSAFPSYSISNKELEWNDTNMGLYANISSSVYTGSIITDFTHIMWVKIPNQGIVGAERGVIGLQDKKTSISFDSISYDQNNDYWKLTSDNALRNVTSNTVETVFNQYLMITATRTSGTNNFRIYKNGSNMLISGSYTPVTYNASTSGIALIIGNRFFNNSTGTWTVNGYWSGSLSSVMMYNRVLSNEEIQQIYNIGRNGIVL